MSQQASLSRNFASLFSSQIITWGCSAAVLIAVPRYLGAEGAGVVSIGMTYATIVTTVAGLGVATMITKEVARSPAAVAGWLGLALLMQVLVSVALGVLAVGVALTSGASPRAVVAVALSCAAVPTLLMASSASAIFQGFERMGWAAVYDVAAKALTLVFVAGAIVMDAGLYAVLLALNAGVGLVAAQQLAHVRRLVPIRLTQVTIARASSVLRECAPYLVIAVVWILYTSIDVILISVLAEEADAGIYSAPVRLFGTMLFVPSTIAIVVFPRLVSVARDDEGAFLRLGGLSLLVAATSSGGIMLASFALSQTAIVMLLGDGFERSGPVMVALSVALIPTAMSTVAGRIAFSNDRQRFVAVVGASAFVAKTLLGLALIPVFDHAFNNPALGAATGLVAVELGMVVAIGAGLPRQLWSASLRRRFWGLGAALTGGMVVLATCRLFGPTLVAGAASVSAYALLLVAGGAHPFSETVEWIRHARPRRSQSAVTV